MRSLRVAVQMLGYPLRPRRGAGHHPAGGLSWRANDGGLNRWCIDRLRPPLFGETRDARARIGECCLILALKKRRLVFGGPSSACFLSRLIADFLDHPEMVLGTRAAPCVSVPLNWSTGWIPRVVISYANEGSGGYLRIPVCSLQNAQRRQKVGLKPGC